YFPEGLPAEWQFAYYANEASCLVLPAPDWLALAAEEVSGWVEDCPAGFRFYLEWPARDTGGGAVDQAALFREWLGAILVTHEVASPLPGVPAWRAQDSGVWVDSQGRERLMSLRLGERDDLKALRSELASLPATVEALLVEDRTPDSLMELRTLCELLGIA
ncbi:MAG: hypothetical protein D6720_12470, partial [Gammaproteobacteria bacterium]